MRTHSDHRWPGPIAIGLTSAGDLTFLLDEYATGAAAEMDRWRAATTWSEARGLASRPEFVEPPFFLDDLTDAEDGDAVFVVSDLGVVADGDWPPSAQTLSLELVETKLADGEVFGVGAVLDTAFNGPILMISADDEDALRRVLEGAGCSVRRDDDVIGRAGEV